MIGKKQHPRPVHTKGTISQSRLTIGIIRRNSIRWHDLG